MSTLFPEGRIPHVKVKTMKYDIESEQDQEYRDRVEKHYRNFLRNVNVGDIGDALEEASQDTALCVRILGALYEPVNKEVIANNILEKLHAILRRLAEREADNED